MSSFLMRAMEPCFSCRLWPLMAARHKGRPQGMSRMNASISASLSFDNFVGYVPSRLHIAFDIAAVPTEACRHCAPPLHYAL